MRAALSSSVVSALLRLVTMGCCVRAAAGHPFGSPLDLDVTPRVTVATSGLQSCRRFQVNTVNYSVLLLEPEGERMYVGARGAVFSLNASDISSGNRLTIDWEASLEQQRQCRSKGRDNETECFNHIRFLQRFNATHLYMCGTHAFRPLCAYIEEENFVISSQPEDGKDKCPYDPTTGYTGLIIDQQMYTASQYEFQSLPDIRRNSPSPALKTEDAPTRWLNEAEFVASSLVKESEGSGVAGDDDKIYFFFTEWNQEQTASPGRSRAARVSRVCKGDRGGHLTLQKRWTSFLKARLVCSLPEYDFHFNVLRSMYILHGASPGSTMFYGVFGPEWKNAKASAVCRFSLSEVEEAFRGPFMEDQDSGSKWMEYTGKIPEPRPGTCMTDALRARGINSSTSLPDDVLDFVRRHPLMSKQIQPSDKRPLLFRRSTGYTQIAVDTVQGVDGHVYHVLFLGTGEGWLHKAVQVDDQVHIIEELQLFEEAQPVNSLLVSDTQMSVYVGSPSGVVQLPLSSCGRYASCYDCVFSRDPYCAWNGARCVAVRSHAADRSNLIQDIKQGNRGCENCTGDEHVVQRSRSVHAGDDVLLQCELGSNLATPAWTLGGRELRGYGLRSGFRTGTDGLLIIQARPDQGGRYTCHALENDVRVAVVAYDVTVHPAPPSDTPALPSPSRGPLSLPLSPLLPRPERLSPRDMEAVYLSLITVLGALCVVLSVVLLYVGFCLRVGSRGTYSLRAAAAARPDRKQRRQLGRKQQQQQRGSSHKELKTISTHCNGGGDSAAYSDVLLQIVPGEGRSSPRSSSKDPPLQAAPPLPPPPLDPLLPSPDGDFPGGLSATLPAVLRRMHGSSYVLLRQSDTEVPAPLCYSFTEELSKILEKRKHAHILPRPDESSV